MPTDRPSPDAQARGLRLRRRIARAFFQGLAVLGLVFIAWGAWRTGMTRGAIGLALFALTTAALSCGAVSIWLAPILDERPERSKHRMPPSPGRDERLRRALEFLPEPRPAGWTRPFSPKLTRTWLAFSTDVAIVWWVIEDDEIGDVLYVALTSRDLQRRVADERVGDILAQFRSVGPFAEMLTTPASLSEKYPAARTWVALPYETLARLTIPDRPAKWVDEPLDEYLAATRRHLPDKLPEGWSTPVAFDGRDDVLEGLCWMIGDRDVVMVVNLIDADDRQELAVTLFQPDGTRAAEEPARRALAHIRGVGAFAPADMDPSDDGPITYVARVQGTTSRVEPH
jgi:hypothetical protein